MHCILHYTLFSVLDISDLALLHSVLKEAMNGWEIIGIHLLPYNEVGAIKEKGEGSELALVEVLAKCLQSTEKKCSIRNLQLALEVADFQHLASCLLQELNSKCQL